MALREASSSLAKEGEASDNVVDLRDAPTGYEGSNDDSTNKAMDDPYIWLEEIESEASLEFARNSNDQCLLALGNPETKSKPTASLSPRNNNLYERLLAVLESKDRIPYVSQYGHDDNNEPILVNFWKDDINTKGLWRKTTLSSYRTPDPVWETILDVDKLAKQDGISWVWKGVTALPRSCDDPNAAGAAAGQRVTRCLIRLSRGGSDAVHVKEFDFTTGTFVNNEPSFDLPEGKSRITYKSRNVALVGSTLVGPDPVTDSGYPRTVREWVRGTNLEDAPIVHEGETTDVSVGMYIADERVWGGDIYEVKYRTITFYTSKYWIRKIPYELLLAPNHPQRLAFLESSTSLPTQQDFVQLDIQEDAEINFLGKLLFITLRSDWNPTGSYEYRKGSVLYTNIMTFLEHGSSGCQYMSLFEPTDRTAYEYFTATTNYLILSTMNDVKEVTEFFRITNNGSALIRVRDNSEQQSLQQNNHSGRIRACSCNPVDPFSGSDMFWFTTSDYTTPSTLYLADASKLELGQQGLENKSIEPYAANDDSFITEKLKALPSQYDASNLITEQHFATSKDGTQVPYFIVYNHQDTVMDGTNPTLLYGYGGFEVSLGPKYIATTGVVWLERGGVYVEANIRGGGEYGPKWHQAALKENRNKAYEDFIAVAEDLIHTLKICSPNTLAIRGGSNGGLLVANMYVMRPDLFGAVHCAVPLIDMKRYHKLLAGASWMAEYGDPDVKEEWEYLQKYSPYHNIDPNASYPAILVTTSTRDDRVHPAHARKFVKKLWDMGKGKWKVYYYENIEGGHGGAADSKQTAFMTTLAYDFLFETITSNTTKVNN